VLVGTGALLAVEACRRAGLVAGTIGRPAESAPVAGASGRTPATAAPRGDSGVPRREAFDAWLLGRMMLHEGDGAGLVHYYEHAASGPELLSPMVTAKTGLYLLATGRLDEAKACADALYRFQVPRDGPGHLRGGLASSIVRGADGRLVSGDAYYAGDNLVAAWFFHALFRRTGEAAAAAAAAAACTFVCESLMSGLSAGVWAEDHGAPMALVRRDGARVNRINTHVELAWLRVLSDVGRVIRSGTLVRAFERSSAFHASGLQPSGAMLDHYEPGWPPARFDPARWRPYSTSGQLIGDNLLRAAVGWVRLGFPERARGIVAFLKPDDGAVPGYLDGRTGAAGFVARDRVYHDVVCSGLLRSVANALGDGALARRCEAYLARTQDETSGGWFWGLHADDLTPVEPKRATLTGLWAVHDFLGADR
jgi:hypothetical protein